MQDIAIFQLTVMILKQDSLQVIEKYNFYTAKINDIWIKNEINNNNNHKAS